MKFKKQAAVAVKSKPSRSSQPKLHSVPTQSQKIPQTVNFVATNCHHCGNGLKSVKREFSPHALRALIAWGEFRRENVDQPICDGCYKDIRDILIERSDEILQSPLAVIASTVQARSKNSPSSARR